jgi:hypothetical protein
LVSLELLLAKEGKALSHFVAIACGAKEASVQEEFFGDESGETRLKAHLGLESSKVMPAVVAASKRYVGLEGTRLGNESAELRSCSALAFQAARRSPTKVSP